MKKLFYSCRGLMYTTSWGMIFFGMPATALVMLLFVAEDQMTLSDAARAIGIMLVYEAAIAFPLNFAAKWLSRPAASQWWKVWRV